MLGECCVMEAQPSPALFGLLTTWNETCGAAQGQFPLLTVGPHSSSLCVLGWAPLIDRSTICGSAAADPVLVGIWSVSVEWERV